MLRDRQRATTWRFDSDLNEGSHVFVSSSWATYVCVSRVRVTGDAGGRLPELWMYERLGLWKTGQPWSSL